MKRHLVYEHHDHLDKKRSQNTRFPSPCIRLSKQPIVGRDDVRDPAPHGCQIDAHPDGNNPHDKRCHNLYFPVMSECRHNGSLLLFDIESDTVHLCIKRNRKLCLTLLEFCYDNSKRVFGSRILVFLTADIGAVNLFKLSQRLDSSLDPGSNLLLCDLRL